MHRGQTGSPAGLPAAELRLVLLGTIGCGKTLSADTILGQRSSDAPFVSSRSCHVRSGVVEGRRLTVVEAPRWYWDGGHMELDVRTETERALHLVAPGPHAFLLLVPIGQFTEVEGRVPGELEEVFGSEVLRHTLVLLTCGDYLTGRDPTTVLDREDPGLREVIRRCSGRYHIINNRQPHDREQVDSLIEKVEEMTQKNGGCFVKTKVVTKEQVKERETEWTEADGMQVEKEGKGRTPAVLVRITSTKKGSNEGLIEASAEERRREEERAGIEERVMVKPRANGLHSACVPEPQNGRPIHLEKASSFRLTSDGALLSQLSEEVKPAKKVVNTFHHRINSFEDKSLSPEPYSPSSLPPFISSSPPSSSSPPTSLSSLSSSSTLAYSLPSIPPVSSNFSPPPESFSSLDDSSSSPLPPPSSSYPRPSSYLSFFSASSSSSSSTPSTSSLPTSSPSSSISSSTASHSAQTTSSSSPQISSNKASSTSSTSFSQSSSSSTPMSSSKSSLSSSQQPNSFSQSSSSSSPASSSKFSLSSSEQSNSFSQSSSSSSPTSSSKFSLSSSEQPNSFSQSSSSSTPMSSSKSSLSSLEQPNSFSQSSSSSSPASSSKFSLSSSEQPNSFSQSSSSSSPASSENSSLSYSQLADSISRSSYPSPPVPSPSPSSSSFISSSSSSTPELRLVLLGRSGAGKSAAGNTILHSEEFVSRPACATGSSVATATQQCEKKKAMVAGRRVAVVDTPDWFYSEHTPDEVRSQISSCVTLSAPGPHAFLLCVPVDEPAKAELQSLRALEVVFGPEAVRKHTLVLFTHADRLMDCGKVAVSEGVPGVEAYIASKRGDLLKVVEKCGDRYHVLERGGREDERRSVEELLEKVEQSVQDGGGACYSCPAFQEAEDRVRERQEEMARERRGGRGGGEGGRGGHKEAERRVLYRSMQTVRESEEDEENEEKEMVEMERMREEAEKIVSNMNLESLPILSSSTLSPSMFQIMWERVAEGAKMVPELLGAGAQDIPKMMGSVAELVSESSLWEKIGAGVKKTPQIGATKLGSEADFAGESLIGEKDGGVERQQQLMGARPTQLGSEFDLNAQSSMWEKVGAGVKQFPQLVNAGAQSVGTGAKIVAKSSMWQKATEEAKKVPKPVAGGALLGLVLGVFFGGPLGGAVGAGVGGLGSEVARRKLTNTKPVDSTDGTTPKQVDRIGATLAEETVVWGGNQAVLKQSPQLMGAGPTQLGSEFDLNAQNSMWEKVGAGVKQFPQLVGSGAKMVSESSMWEKVGAGVKQFPQLVNAGAQSVGTGAKIVAESSMWQKATEEAKKVPKPVAGGALAGLVLGGFFGGPLGGAVGAGVGGLGSEVARRKLSNTKPVDSTDGTTPKQVDRVGATLAEETVVWGGNQAVLKQSPQLMGAGPTQLGSEFDLNAQNSMWEKVGAGVKQFPQLVGSGAKMVAESSMWEKVGAGVKQLPQLVNAGAQSVGTGAKIVAESSMWQKATEEAKKVPKPVAGGALAGLVLGGFFGGPLGGAVGAGVGGLGSEVARRKLTNTKPVDSTDGTTPKQVDRIGATLAEETVVWGGNQAVLKQSPQLMGAGPTQLGSEFDLNAQNSMWEKVGAGVKQFPQLVGSGAKMVAESSMWEKVGTGVKQLPQLVNAGAQSVGTGAKIVAESSMWQKATEEAKKVPKPVAGGALAGLVLGVFYGGPLGGAVGAGVGGLGSEVARRKLTKNRAVDSTDGAKSKQVDKALDNRLNILNSQKQLKRD